MYRVNTRWRADEGERGAEINHLTSGWSVHLCLGDGLQIGCDIQEHLGGHGSAPTHTHTHTRKHEGAHIQSHSMLAHKHMYVQRGISITAGYKGIRTVTQYYKIPHGV